MSNMTFSRRAHSDESALLKSNLGRLHRERADILGSLSCAVARGENIEAQLNDIKVKLTLAEHGDETHPKKILKKRIRTLKFQLTQCRRTEDALAANLDLVTERIQYTAQHQWNHSHPFYAQYSYPESPQLYDSSPILTSPFVPFSPSFPLVTSPISYDQGMQSFSMTPIIVSPLTPSPTSSTWSQWSESDISNISDPNSPRGNLRGMPNYQMQLPRTPSSDSSAPPSPYYTNYSLKSPVIWQNWSFGPSSRAYPQSPIDLISPMTNLNIGDGSSWSPKPLPLHVSPRQPMNRPDPTPVSIPKPNPALKRSKFQFQNFPSHDRISNAATKTSSASKFQWGENDPTVQSTSTSTPTSNTPISIPASIPGGEAIILNPAPQPKTRISTATVPVAVILDVTVTTTTTTEATSFHRQVTTSRKRSLSQVYGLQSNGIEEEELDSEENDSSNNAEMKGVHRSRSRIRSRSC